MGSVLYFAGVADITQQASEQVVLTQTESTVDEVLTTLINQYGAAFNTLVDTCLFAVDMEYVPRSQTVRTGQEIAIIPPVSGG